MWIRGQSGLVKVRTAPGHKFFQLTTQKLDRPVRNASVDLAHGEGLIKDKEPPDCVLRLTVIRSLSPLVLDWCREATFANVARATRHDEPEPARSGERWREGGEGPVRSRDNKTLALADNDEE